MYVPVTTTSSETNRPRRRFSPAVFPIMSMPRPRGRSRFSRANGDHPPGSARGGLRITKAPCRTAPICVGMFEPRAVPVVINLDIRNAVPIPVPPNGPASERGASPTRRRGQPIGSEMRRQARLRPAGVREGPPVPMPPRRGCSQMQRSTRAFLSPKEPENRRASVTAVKKP